MKKLILTVLFCFCVVTSANALSISTSATGNFFDDSYGYTFTIDDTYHATLENTSSSSLADALIDVLAFNMNPNLIYGTDFTI